VETLGDSVVASEAPHSDDFFRPVRQSLSELNQRGQAGLAQLIHGSQKAWNKLLALLARAMFLQQQVTQPLLEPVDGIEHGMLG